MVMNMNETHRRIKFTYQTNGNGSLAVCNRLFGITKTPEGPPRCFIDTEKVFVHGNKY